jgi:hypothetical protein
VFDDLRGPGEREDPIRPASEHIGNTFDFMLLYERVAPGWEVEVFDEDMLGDKGDLQFLH